MNGYYIIDPKGDLGLNIHDKFKSLLCENNTIQWNGIMNEIPNEMHFFNELNNSYNKVFLYIGHNGGEQYISLNKLKKYNTSNKIILLMGCSSGLLKSHGIYYPNGISNSYIISNSSIIVANLWDVTDKDIDNFSKYLLNESICINNNNDTKNIPNISKCVVISRFKCKLKYINGSSPICYGNPYHIIYENY